MATPFVSGAISSFWSRHPDLSPLQVKQNLLNTVDNLGFEDQILSGGRMNIATLQASAGTKTASIASETTSTPTIPLKEVDLNNEVSEITDEVILFLKGRHSARKRAARKLINFVGSNNDLFDGVDDIDVMTALRSRMAIVDFQDLVQDQGKVAILKNLFDRDLIGGFQFDQPINLV